MLAGGNYGQRNHAPLDMSRGDRRVSHRRHFDKYMAAVLAKTQDAANDDLGGISSARKQWAARVARKHDPRVDPRATLEDFVRRINRIGFPNAHRVEYPIWTIEDIKWAAFLTEKLFRKLAQLPHRTDLDPLDRVLLARMAVIDTAHTMKYRTSNRKSRQIVRNLPEYD